MGTDLRTVAAAVVETVQAPPAVVFLQALQCQMPTAVRLTASCERSQSQSGAPMGGGTKGARVDGPCRRRCTCAIEPSPESACGTERLSQSERQLTCRSRAG